MGDSEDVFKDAFADPPEFTAAAPRPRGKNRANFILLYGVGGLNTYLVKRRAEITLPLLLALQRRLDLKNEVRVALTPRVWRDAGNPPKNRRVSILAQLRRMPDLVTLHASHHIMYRYRVEKGPAWLRIERDGRAGYDSSEEDLEDECLVD
jgi:hypothetical protein